MNDEVKNKMVIRFWILVDVSSFLYRLFRWLDAGPATAHRPLFFLARREQVK